VMRVGNRRGAWRMHKPNDTATMPGSVERDVFLTILIQTNIVGAIGKWRKRNRR